MEVLNTTSPTLKPGAPIETPRNTVPSANTRMAGLDSDTGGFSKADTTDGIKKRDELSRSRYSLHCTSFAAGDQLAQSLPGAEMPHIFQCVSVTVQNSAGFFITIIKK